MTKSALILGATGRFGRHMAQAMQAAGWQTRAFDRDHHDLDKMASAADVIVYGWNPEYTDWDKECMPQLTRVISAARNSGATILFPANIYPYGHVMPAHLTEATPHNTTRPMGGIRRDMEQALKASGVKTIILRAGDFIDTEPSGNWFDLIITKNTHKNGKISYPGNPDIPHAWAYLPDFARAFTGLVDKQDELPVFTSLNFAGYTLSGAQVAGVLNAKVKKMSWLPLQIASPFWKMGKCLLEMRYLWNTPHSLDGHAMAKMLPDFRATPAKKALQSAVSFDIDPDQSMIGTRLAV